MLEHGLLDEEINRTKHLCAINSAPADTWQTLTTLLVENTWSVKDTKAAVDRVIGLTTACPKWLSGIHVHPKKGLFQGQKWDFFEFYGYIIRRSALQVHDI